MIEQGRLMKEPFWAVILVVLGINRSIIHGLLEGAEQMCGRFIYLD